MSAHPGHTQARLSLSRDKAKCMQVRLCQAAVILQAAHLKPSSLLKHCEEECQAVAQVEFK